MTTQRVDCYISGSGKTIFEIQQYSHDNNAWYDIGGTYDKFEHAQSQVESHNIEQILNKLLFIKNSKDSEKL